MPLGRLRALLVLPFLLTCAAAHDSVEFADVLPILASGCGGSGCHINEVTSGVEFTTHESLLASVGEQYGMPVVVPGSLELSPLLDKIESEVPLHGEPMPLGGDRLGPSAIDALREWIREGAINSHLPQRGDTDGDEKLTVTDARRILDYLFLAGKELPCLAQADANASATVDLADAVSILNYLFLGGPRLPELTEEEGRVCKAAGELSFESIYEKVFAVSCAFSSCHSAAMAKGGLSLGSLEAAHDNLVGVGSANLVAQAAGLLRVDPGRPATSFLLRKLAAPGPGEGNRMPANSPEPLAPAVVEAIRQWILGGAPREGTIDGVPDITAEPAPPIDRLSAPPVPENGVQMRMPPLVVGPRRERQTHYFGGAPFATSPKAEVWVDRIDIHMLEQSHHFILFQWVGARSPRAGFREGTNISIFTERIVAVSQQSFFSLTFPEGVGIRFASDTAFDLNSHYVNLNSDETLYGDVYINFFFAEPGSIETEVKPIFDFGGTIRVPPNQTTTSYGVFPNISETRRLDPTLASVNGRVNRQTHIYALVSHTHRHGVHFDVHRYANGAIVGDPVYENWNWDDPEYVLYDPPLVLESHEGLRYSATFTYDDPPSPTSAPLTFGTASEDEMIILLGYYAVPLREE